MEQIARVEQFRKAWVERKSAEEVKSAALIKSNANEGLFGIKARRKAGDSQEFLERPGMQRFNLEEHIKKSCITNRRTSS
jgi:hypothetical protein